MAELLHDPRGRRLYLTAAERAALHAAGLGRVTIARSTQRPVVVGRRYNQG